MKTFQKTSRFSIEWYLATNEFIAWWPWEGNLYHLCAFDFGVRFLEFTKREKGFAEAWRSAHGLKEEAPHFLNLFKTRPVVKYNSFTRAWRSAHGLKEETKF